MRNVRCSSAFLIALAIVLQVSADDRPVGRTTTKEKPYGLSKRLPLLTSQLYGSPEPPLPFRAAPAFGEKVFNQPVYLLAEPGSKRLLVADYTGKILSFEDPALSEGPAKEPVAIQTQELLAQSGRMYYSFAFHPRYEANRYLYLFSNGITKESGKSRRNRLSRFTVSKSAPFACDPKSELIIIEWNSNGHDGGDLAFGKDGYLYMTAGDGTTDSDTNVTGQDISDLNSGLLRIDVDHPDGDKKYTIPTDNPFRHIKDARHELWAFGFRNPWRLHIDPQGNIWCGDVGQDLWEMIEIVQRADNYGWSVWEGGHPFYLERKVGPSPLKAPAIAHPHSEARSITGGVTYLGKKFPELYGDYVYGDYATGKIWACRYEGGKIVKHREIADTPNQIAAFGIDHAGEIYFSDYGLMKFFTLERNTAEKIPHEFPRKLSETGLFASVSGHRVQAPLIPYSVNSPLWSDGAYKERFIALPGTSQIEFDQNGAWKFPERGVLVKSFALDREKGNSATRTWLETRFMVFQQKEWVGYSYRWNEEQTEAYLVGAQGDDRRFSILDPLAPNGRRTQVWHFPSRAECMVCHSRAGGFILGPQTLQMNRRHDYGGVVDNQIRALVHAGVLTIPVSEHIRHYDERQKRNFDPLVAKLPAIPEALTKATQPVLSHRAVSLTATALAPVRKFWRRGGQLAERVIRDSRERATKTSLAELTFNPSFYGALPEPLDPKPPLEARVKSYLHANCALCHVDAGGGNAAMWLAYHTPMKEMRVLDAIPLHDKFGMEDARIVAPGAPERSVLLKRISHRSRGRMPPLASSIVDDDAVGLISTWIKQLPAKPTAASRTAQAEKTRSGPATPASVKTP